MAIRSYQELDVWKAAMDLAAECYVITRPYPKDELFGMTTQIRRAANSVPANIAEGQGRGTTKEFMHYLNIARGSLFEVETHLQLATRVGLSKPDAIILAMETADRVGRMLSALWKALERKLPR